MTTFVGSGAVYPFKAADTGRWNWVLAEDLTFGTFIARAGFLTDLGSVPAPVRWLFNPADPQLAKAYVLHDAALIEWGPERQMEAAALLLQMLRCLGVPVWSRRLQVIGVVLGIDRW